MNKLQDEIIQEGISFDTIIKFVQDNFPILMIVLVFIIVLFFWIAKYFSNRRTELKRDQIEKWSALKVSNTKLTDKLTLKIYPFESKSFQISGDIFSIDSTIIEKEYTVNEIHTKNLDNIREQIQDINSRMLKSHAEFDEREQGSLTKLLDNLEKQEKRIVSKMNSNVKVSEKLVIKEKTETYVALNKNNEIVGFRMTDLKPSQNVLSKTGYLELNRIDPRRSNWIFYLIISIMGAFEFILLWSISEEKQPDFLFASDMWGWYFSLILFTGFVMYVIKILFGFYAIMYAYQTINEDIKLNIGKKEFTVNIKIYYIETYFYPNINVQEVLDINVDSLAKRINTENQKLISEMSTKISNLRSELEFQKSMLNKKSVIIDTMQEKITVERALGYFEGRQDNSATPTVDEMKQSSQIDWNQLLLKMIPMFFGLIILIIAIISLKYIADSIQLDSLQTTLLIGGGVVMCIFILLVALRGVFESTRRAPIS